MNVQKDAEGYQSDFQGRKLNLEKDREASLKNIGNLLGKRDHTTIINGHNKIEAELKSNNASIKNNIDIIMKKINPM